MNFEATSSRESYVEYCGKRRIVWHGILIIYFEIMGERQEDGSYKDVKKRKNTCANQTLECGNENYSPVVIAF